MPIENHPTAAASEWLTLAFSLERGPRSLDGLYFPWFMRYVLGTAECPI